MSKKNVSLVVSGAGWIGGLADGLIKALRERGVSDETIHSLVEGGELPIGKIADELIRIIHQEVPAAVQMTILRLISGGEPLVLDAVDGTEVLAEANEIFTRIDPDFKRWNADQPGQPTAEMVVGVHEIIVDATFSQMFGELNADISKLCLSQHQIKNFVKKHRRWLRSGGYATFFLFVSHNDFFVAYVHARSDDSLSVYVDQFDDSYVWNAEYSHRLVAPRLA